MVDAPKNLQQRLVMTTTSVDVVPKVAVHVGLVEEARVHTCHVAEVVVVPAYTY